jgi:glycosyltransferase involved in cell wall biosynthesis
VKLLVDARVGWGHGIGRVISSTVPRVAALRPDWQIEALVPPDQLTTANAAFHAVSNLRAISCPIAPFSFAEQTSLQRYAKSFDLTWFTNYWVPLGWRGPFVATVHDMLHLLPQLVPASYVRRSLARQTFAKVRRDARAVLFVSRYTEGEFRRMIGDPRRGVTVQNGGDHLDYGDPKPMAERTRRLLVVAASKKHKNFALLFDAWRKAQIAEHWTLTVISPKEMLLNSVDLAEMASAEPRVEIRRSVSNVELAALYADSAILLMPSLYEGFGLPLLEGMLAGAFCVSSNAGAMIEIADGAFVSFVNGTDLVGWVSALEQACDMIDRGQPDLDALLRHNVECASRFRWDRTAGEIAAVLEAAV